ncbi:MAG: hypothetical protein ABSC51_01650 [Gaiellaceae bacterium]|jgi:uncharacterized membrane protein
MMRHGGIFGYSQHAHDAGTSSIEWAVFGIAIAILVGVILLLTDRYRHRRQHRRGWSHHGGFDKPLAILRLRYSQGEITRDQFLQASRDLGVSPESAESEAVEPAPPAPRRRGRK